MNGTYFVLGLTWSYTLEGNSVASSHMNCVEVHSSDDTDGDHWVTIAVAAGGATLQVSVPII